MLNGALAIMRLLRQQSRILHAAEPRRLTVLIVQPSAASIVNSVHYYCITLH